MLLSMIAVDFGLATAFGLARFFCYCAVTGLTIFALARVLDAMFPLIPPTQCAICNRRGMTFFCEDCSDPDVVKMARNETLPMGGTGTEIKRLTE